LWAWHAGRFRAAQLPRAPAKSALTELALAAGCSASKFGLAADDDSKDSDDEREPLLAAAAARACVHKHTHKLAQRELALISGAAQGRAVGSLAVAPAANSQWVGGSTPTTTAPVHATAATAATAATTTAPVHATAGKNAAAA